MFEPFNTSTASTNSLLFMPRYLCIVVDITCYTLLSTHAKKSTIWLLFRQLHIDIWLSTWSKIWILSEKSANAFCLPLEFVIMAKWNWSAFDCYRPLINCFSLAISHCPFSYVYTQRDSRSAQRKHSDFSNPISYSANIGSRCCWRSFTILICMQSHDFASIPLARLWTMCYFCAYNIRLLCGHGTFQRTFECPGAKMPQLY